MSTFAFQAAGATPIAIASATKPSIRPDERFFDSLQFDASGPSTTALLAHIVRTGCPPCRSLRSRMSNSSSRNAGDIDFVPCPNSTNVCSSKCSEKPAFESHGRKCA